ncbi:DUF1192 domain-containing protein [Rhizobiales bacterium]|uniref:DUF1192 domain-containing protein n=1 Tax=Hongsoonwoonella zoysiae TaxID=2821844 RepID=UPI00155F60B6|nr:DUF1192 domain-containing protein [Hongsoonwoonella zoysiae]NRG17362.1 DUF1192 domain-containing protein [Hongsoonwoonella zoysiae]
MKERDDDLPLISPGAEIRVGEDLARLSVNELDERLNALELEVERVRKERDNRSGIREAADAIFRK